MKKKTLREGFIVTDINEEFSERITQRAEVLAKDPVCLRAAKVVGRCGSSTLRNSTTEVVYTVIAGGCGKTEVYRMSGEEAKKGAHKGGEIVRLEPHGMTIIKANHGYEELFRKAGCLRFYQKMDGHHVGVSHLFTVNFEGEASRVGDLIIPVSELDISVATGIPAEGEKWFKGNYFDVDECKKLFAEGYEDTKLSIGAPRACIGEEDDELLKVIQRLFTYEGRFNLVYAYHMRLLMHFREVKPLNIPFFLHRSLRKMSDKVKKHPTDYSSHFFHCGLIRLLIVKELAKRKKTRGSFLEKLGYVQIPPVPLC